MLAQNSQIVNFGFTNRPKGDILRPCTGNGTVITFRLVIVSNTGRVTSGDWYSLGVALFLFLICIISGVLRRPQRARAVSLRHILPQKALPW